MNLRWSANETWLHHKEREWASGSYPRPWRYRFLLGCIHFARRWDYRWRALSVRRREVGTYRDSDLVYAAFARCKGCRAGLAYPHGIGVGGHWDCSRVLKGEIAPTNEHATYSFVFYEIKSERQSSANGATTRPGVARVIHGALRDSFGRA